MHRTYGRLICKNNESTKYLKVLSKEIKQNYLFSMRRVTTVQVLAVGFVAVGDQVSAVVVCNYYIFNGACHARPFCVT